MPRNRDLAGNNRQDRQNRLVYPLRTCARVVTTHENWRGFEVSMRGLHFFAHHCNNPTGVLENPGSPLNHRLL